MNISELTDTIATNHDLTKVEARKLLDGVLGAIVSTLAKGEEVALAGFGKFVVKHTPARAGRNPATGAAIQIAASNKLAFTAAKALKDRLNP